MKRFTPGTLAMATLIAVAACAASAVPAEGNSRATPHKARASGSEMIRSVAEVVAIDEKTRTLALRRDDGNTLTVVVAPGVRNLAQMRVGDIVVAEYGRAQAHSLEKTAGLEPPGAGKAAATNRRSIVADIVAIDDKKGFATLKGAKGNVVDVVVKDRKALGKVKIGDLVRLEYTDAVAVSVKPARTKR